VRIVSRLHDGSTVAGQAADVLEEETIGEDRMPPIPPDKYDEGSRERQDVTPNHRRCDWQGFGEEKS
jgi:hypothetical protein